MKQEETNLNFKYDSSLSKIMIFFDNRKTRSPFVWEEKRFHLIEHTSSRELVELKIEKYFFSSILSFWILIFSNFSIFWRDFNELEEIDKVEVKKNRLF